MAECVFCNIVSGSVPAFMVGSEEAGIAFLDARPVFPGHILVIPRAHIPTLTDLPTADLPGYFLLVQRVAAAVEAGMGAAGTFVAMNNRVSQSVPHLHTHVVPRRYKDGLRGFFWPRRRYASDAEAASIASAIAAVFTGS